MGNLDYLDLGDERSWSEWWSLLALLAMLSWMLAADWTAELVRPRR